jgi:hypothetical protein
MLEVLTKRVSPMATTLVLLASMVYYLIVFIN